MGPHSIIGPDVEVGPGTQIGSCVLITGRVIMGSNNRIFHGAVIGEEPQDVKFNDEETGVIIGDNNLIREYVTVHRATGQGNTIVGNNNMLMAYSHIAHNVQVGNNTVIVNAAQLGGHSVVEDHAFISALCTVHQFVRIGKHAITGGSSRVNQDVPPFMMAVGYEAEITGVNRVGLRRRGFSSQEIDNIVEAYRILYRSGLATSTALNKLKQELGNDPNIQYLLNFFDSTKRGVIRKSRKSARK